MTPPQRDAHSISPRAVAKHLDRRRMRRKIVGLALLMAAVVAAVMYARCGGGWGLGGGGDGRGNGRGDSRQMMAVRDAGTARCSIVITADGIMVDGETRTRDEAVAACKGKAGADVRVAGDTLRGDRDALMAALDAAKVPVYVLESATGSAPSP